MESALPSPDPILLVANPNSGRGKGRRIAEETAAALRRADVATTLEFTSATGDAERIARAAIEDQATPLGCIVACGGDGTVQEVANAVAAARAEEHGVTVPLGVAPAGRCNDFARAIGVPVDPAVIADIILEGRRQALDLGKVNGRYFCTVVTTGIDAEVTGFVDRMRLPIKGTIAYLYGAMCVLVRYRAPRMRIDGDFGLIEGRMFLASGANTSSYGGAIPIAPPADPTDGVLHLCVIRNLSRLRALALVPTLLRGRHLSLPEVRMVTTKRFVLDAEQPLELWADGERVAQTPATIEAAPAALTVMVPA